MPCLEISFWQIKHFTFGACVVMCFWRHATCFLQTEHSTFAAWVCLCLTKWFFLKVLYSQTLHENLIFPWTFRWPRIWFLVKKYFGQRSQNNFLDFRWTESRCCKRAPRHLYTFRQKQQVWGSLDRSPKFPLLARSFVTLLWIGAFWDLYEFEARDGIFRLAMRFKHTVGCEKLTNR